MLNLVETYVRAHPEQNQNFPISFPCYDPFAERDLNAQELRRDIPSSRTVQWGPHKACAEPAEVKTVEKYQELVEQVNGLEEGRLATLPGSVNSGCDTVPVFDIDFPGGASGILEKDHLS